MTPSEVRQAITTRIAALPVDSSYGSTATDAWREAKVPLVPEYDPEPAAHLSFFVDNRNLNLNRSRANASEQLYPRTIWTIRFLSRMRATARVDDWDKADVARVDLWKWLLASGWTTEFGITPADTFSTFQIIGDWVAVNLSFEITFSTEAV